MKGIIFLGCSYTWGQGLYFYSDLKQLPYGTQNYGFNYKEVNESMLRYKNAVRFPRLVSQHFETWQDIHLSHHLISKPKWAMQIQLFANNIFNKKYEPSGYTYSYIYGGLTTTSNNYFPMAGTNFWCSLKVDLK